MSHGRGHFVCGAIFGIALGFAVGHLMVRARMPASSLSVAVGPVPAPVDVGSDIEALSVPRARIAQRESGNGPTAGSIFDRYPVGGRDRPVAARSVITADAFRKDAAAADSSPPPQEPSPLPQVEALPIPPDSRVDESDASAKEAGAERDLPSLLEEELRSASPQQREIWKDALDGVPSGDAAEILRMWKSIGREPAAGGLLSGLSPVPEPLGAVSTPSLPSPARSAPSPYYPLGPGLTPSPLSASGLSPSPFQSPGQSVRVERLRVIHPTVWRQLRRDLAHVETPGYRRSIPELENADDGPSGPRFRIAALRTDLAAGKPIETGRMCDVCLTGRGFLSVQLENGTGLTRLGRLGLDGERRLGVRIGAGILPLIPEITIPPDALGFEIARDGRVSIPSEGADPPESLVGRIEPVEVMDASRLAESDELAGVLVVTPQSGAPRRVPPDRFTLQQYVLEGSNVDPEETRRWINRLEALAAEEVLVEE